MLLVAVTMDILDVLGDNVENSVMNVLHVESEGILQSAVQME